MEAEESQENPGFQSCAAVTRLLAVQHCTGKCMWWYVMMYGGWKINHAQVYRMNELIKNINFGDLKNENDYKCAHMNFIGHGASSTGRSCLKKRTGHQCHLFLLRVNATLFVGSSRKCWMSVKGQKFGTASFLPGTHSLSAFADVSYKTLVILKEGGKCPSPSLSRLWGLYLLLIH